MTIDNEKSIEELCKPLSAKVMHQKALYSISGKPLEGNQAIKSQRKQIGTSNKKKKK